MNVMKRWRHGLGWAAALAVVVLGSARWGWTAENGTGHDVVELTSLLVLQVSVILFAAWVGRQAFNRMRLPSVLGEILAGVLIGPYCLGQLPLPGFEAGFFPISGPFPVSMELYSLATIASIILLFFVGLETDIETFLRFSFVGSVIGVMGVVVSFVAGDLLGVLFFRYILNEPVGVFGLGPIFLGVISTATSVGITARILSDRRKMNSPEGTTILAAAVIDDVLGIIILAVVLAMARSGRVGWKEVSLISIKEIVLWLGFTFLGLRYGRRISEILKKMGDRNTIAVMAFGLAMLFAGIFERSGLAMIVGAYVAGLSLSKTDLSFILQEKLEMLQQFFVPVFFCVMGMLVNLQEMASLKIVLFGLLYVVFAVAGKILGCSLPALFLNFNLRGALRIGVGMVPRGEVALIIAGIGLSAGIIGDEVFSLAMIMTFVTTLISPPVLDRMLAGDQPVLRREQEIKTDNEVIAFAMPNPETAELVLSKVLAAFENEGFFVYRMSVPERLYQIRKDAVFISLQYTAREMVFDCLTQDKVFVHTLFYEAIAELEYAMRNLQTLTDKKLIGRRIFDVGAGQRGGGPAHFRIPSPRAVKADLAGQDKEAILAELVDLTIQSGQLDPARKDRVLQELLEREAVMSTGMQDGIAVPHVKSTAVDQVAFAAGVCRRGVDFHSLDKAPSTIFVLILASKANPKEYLQSLSEICRFLADEPNRRQVLSCQTEGQLFSVLSFSV